MLQMAMGQATRDATPVNRGFQVTGQLPFSD
jgi:hypothetical protein